MIQQGQVFKLKTKGPDGQPLWATGTGSKVAARSGRSWVGSRHGRRRRRHCGRCSTGSGRAAVGQRLRSPSSSTSTWRCTRRHQYGGEAALAARQGNGETW
jgi:hypothetical protein